MGRARARRARVVVLLAVTSGLLSVLLAVAVNVATGGSLPGPLAPLAPLAWPAVAVLGGVAVYLTVWQQRLAEPEPGPPPAVPPAQALGPPTGEPRPPAPAELPAAAAYFAGRAEDLAAIDRLVEEGSRVLALTGPPGVGKSTLALRVAHDRRAAYPDGQLFAALRGAGPDPVAPEIVLARFLGALGAPPDDRRGGLDDLSARFRSLAADRQLLFVLDDAGGADQVRPLLPGGDGCLVLITSRRLLADLPRAVPHLLGGLAEDEALALLAGATGAARVAADPEGAARLVRLCGGLPLAVRISAARLRSRPAWTPGHLAARLADERRRLDELRTGDVAVRSSFEGAYAELAGPDRRVFRRAGRHPGAIFGVGAAAALVGPDEGVDGVETALERLVDAQLVETPAAGRYRLHDLLRLFAAERLELEEPPDERRAGLDRLLAWYASHAARGRWLAEERDNVLTSVHAGVRAGAHEPVWALVSAIDPLLGTADHADRLALWRDAARAAAALGDDKRRARALWAVCHAHRNAGEIDRALSPAATAVALARRLGDRKTLAHALFAYGETMRDRYRLARAEEALTQALEIFGELGDVASEVSCRSALGTLYNQWWQPERGVPVLERALEILPESAETDDPRVRAWLLQTLTGAYKLSGRRAEAVALNARVLPLARAYGGGFVLVYALIERGWLAYDDGRPDEALRHFRESLATAERFRHRTGVGLAHQAIGEALADLDRRSEAVDEFGAAVAEFDRLRDRPRAAEALLRRAAALAGLGRPDEARADRDRADELAGDLDLPAVRWLRARLPKL